MLAHFLRKRDLKKHVVKNARVIFLCFLSRVSKLLPARGRNFPSFRDKLAPVKLNRYKDDVLFYMYYMSVGELLQLASAAEL